MAQLDLRAQLAAAGEAALARCETVARQAVAALGEEILTAVPVASGHLLANMRPSLGAPDSTVSSDTDPGGAAALARLQETAQALKLGDTFYLTNSLPYAAVVEYGLFRPVAAKAGAEEKTAGGYSAQAPEGMFRLAARRWPDLVARQKD